MDVIRTMLPLPLDGGGRVGVIYDVERALSGNVTPTQPSPTKGEGK